MGNNHDVERVAQLLGMKPSEVVEVLLDVDGVLAQTHDGNWTLIRNDGTLEFRGASKPLVDADEATEAMLRGFRGEPEPEPKKAAPKGRGRA